MTIKFIPEIIPEHLLQTYNVLFSLSKDGKCTATIRQMVTALGLASPAPLLKRLERLQQLGWITRAA
jgi:DNA-binding Lrp family transcriptional regulator